MKKLMSGKGWNRLRARVSMDEFAAGRLLVALDFDGTLAEIAETPGAASLAAVTRSRLLRVIRRADTVVAVISGRALADVRKKVSIPGIYYAGNHGLEIEGPGLKWTHPLAGDVGNPLLRDLEKEVEAFPGAFVEYKGLGAAIHYRRVSPHHHARLRERVRLRLADLKGRFRFLHGKKTFDLRPHLPWGKGHALEAIRKSLPGGWMALFVGDDMTDEEGFRMLGPRALTIRVGRARSSAAEYMVPHRRFVDDLLHALASRAVAPSMAPTAR